MDGHQRDDDAARTLRLTAARCCAGGSVSPESLAELRNAWDVFEESRGGEGSRLEMRELRAQVHWLATAYDALSERERQRMCEVLAADLVRLSYGLAPVGVR